MLNLTNNAQVVTVLSAAILLWVCVAVPEEHHERLVHALHGLATITVVALILALRFLN
jgi:uncharacterized membrane-anchored protein